MDPTTTVEDAVVSERLEATAGLLFGDKTAVVVVELFTDRISSFAAFGPTVITVGRTSDRANVEPGNGSLYGGGLLALIVAVIGMSETTKRDANQLDSCSIHKYIACHDEPLTVVVIYRGICLVFGEAAALSSPFRRGKLFVWQF